MRTLLLILIVALSCPLVGQIVFEELDDVPGTFLQTVNESTTGSQGALTTNAMFGKTVTGPTWIERDQDATGIYNLMYSPDGDLYTKNNNTILHSQDNGENFASIDIPNGIIFFNDAYVYVLDDDVLFVVDGSTGHCYYSLNNGQSWSWSGQYIYQVEPVVRKVDNYIYVAEPYWADVVARIDLTTGQTERVQMSELPGQWGFIFSQILDDGTIYIFAQNSSGPQGEFHLLQYIFGEEIVSLGLFPNINILSFYAVDLEFYSFGPNAGHVYNGFEFQPVSYSGLPQDGDKRFLLSQNNHVYVILDDTRIFRSVRSLAHPGVISGKISLHEDVDCVPDAAERGLAFWRITAEGTNSLRAGISGPDGMFRFSVPEGEYTVSAQSPGNGWELCAGEINVALDANQLTAQVDFLAQATTHCANLSLDFSTPLLRRCFENYYTIHVRNSGPQTSTGTSLILHLDQFFEFHSASIPYNLIDANTVSFDLGTLELNEELTFRIFFTLSCEAGLSVEHCISGNVTADNACTNERSDYTECQENIGSFDPNDKRTFNEHGRQSDQVDKGEYIYYHIRFQNTGTDTAFTVRIIDPLSTQLDLGSFEILSASHPYAYEITDGPTLVADFQNILLPDSTTNEPASHGFLKFRVKPLHSFDYGTTIPNKADIFFDFNDPVLTNETITVILPTVGVHDQHALVEFSVFPNPGKHMLELRIPESDRNRVDAWIIYDSHGRLAAHALYQNNRALDIRSLASGLFTLSLISNGEVIGVRKFVKG